MKNPSGAPLPAPPTATPPRNELERTASGRFCPGHSGNPTGRPRNESTALRQKLAERAEDVLQAVLDAALSGDMAAARMILDRIVPPLRAHTESVHIPLDAPAGPAATAEAMCLVGFSAYFWPSPFWSLPTLTLTASAAAVSIGFINMSANLAGWLGNAAMGWLKAHGRTESELLFLLAGCYLLGAVFVSFVKVQRTPPLLSK